MSKQCSVLPARSNHSLSAPASTRRWFQAIDARPAAARARNIGQGHDFKTVVDEETNRALYPTNYPKNQA